jgi:hypothetical protein
MKVAIIAVSIMPPSRMAVVAVFGNIMESIRNTGISPIAIIFICISLIFIVDSHPFFFPETNNSSFVAEPHMHFESVVLKKKLPEINPDMIGGGDLSGNNLQYKKKGMQPVS